MKRCKSYRCLVFMLFVCLCMGILTGCGDGVTEETKQTVIEKTDQALTLYADLEKLVHEHELEVDKSFTDMKQQLTDMSAKVKQQIAETTEEDGKKAVEELQKIITNLQGVKEKVEKSLVE